METTPPKDEDRAREGADPGRAAGSAGAADAGGAGADPGGEGTRERISEGVRQGIGVLSAFKDALEETIQEARERGELSSDRARELVRSAMSRAREAAGEAKERLDFAPHEELVHLREEVAELRVRLENLEQRMPQDPSVGPSRPAGNAPGGGEPMES